MKRFLLLAVLAGAGLVNALPSGAQEPTAQTEENNVSWRAASEIAIRGNLVERVGGGVQSAESDLLAELAKLPEDDSGKWQITVLTLPNCAACEKLKNDLAHSKEWAGSSLINVQDHTKSWFHYNVYRYDDPTVQDWRKGLSAWLKSHGKPDARRFPQIVLQPPADGSYGPKTEVVFWQVGYAGKPGQLRDTLVKQMQDFAKVMKAPQLVRGGQDGGHGQPIGGYPPPFSLPPASVPASEGEWSPDVLIPPTQTATAAELQAACPGAPAEFLFALLTRQATKEEAAAAWLTEKQRQEVVKMQQQLAAAIEKLKAPPPPEAKAAEPTPVPTKPLGLAMQIAGIFAGGSVGVGGIAVAAGYGIRGILWLRQKRVDAGQTPKISDPMAARLQRLDEFVTMFTAKNSNPPGSRESASQE